MAALALWLESVNMEINLKNYERARPILEKARVKLPNNARLWAAAVKLEIEA